MKLLYVTAKAPWGKGEEFILEEMLEIKNQGIDLLVIPRNPSKDIFHKGGKELLENAIWLPLINSQLIIIFLKAFLTKVSLWKILLSIALYSQNPWIFIKNLMVLPKGVFISKMIQKENIIHIHAHWGSTTATMAYIISQISGTSWSITLHRWDIKENNMIKEKVKSSKFVRCVSQHGKKELLKIIGEEYKEKIKVIHMSVKIPYDISKFSRDRRFFTIVTPANLLEVKGHEYLIEAYSILIKKEIKNFQSIFYGEGLLKNELIKLIKKKELVDFIKMPGIIPHEKLMVMYKSREIFAVVLPSINTNKGEHEGIPVALMEAMAYRVPVVSTNTGGITELLSNGAGIIVEEKNSEELAEAIRNLLETPELQYEIGDRGYQHVKKHFNIHINIGNLLETIKNKQNP